MTIQQLADYCYGQGQTITTFMRSIYMHKEYTHEREGNDFYFHSQCPNMISTLSSLGYSISPFGIIKS